MPRVVPDQKTKYETDELFKKLSQETDVKFTGYKDRPFEERKKKFIDDVTQGHSVITFIVTGTNLNLQFCEHALCDDRSPDLKPSRDRVNFEKEHNKVHLLCGFIMNGVCVKWVGWIDLDSLGGKAKLMFDEEKAKEEDELMQQVVKETQERIRLMEESQRRWQQDHMSPPTMAQQTVPQ